MKLELVTCRFEAEGGFPREPLAGIPGDIVSVVEHFFSIEGWPHLLLVVHWRDEVQRGTATREGAPDPRADLDEAERAMFEKVRAWRNSRAEVMKVSAYIVLTNRQIAELVKRKPTTLAALEEVPGLGKAKLEKFGTDLLGVLNASP